MPYSIGCHPEMNRRTQQNFRGWNNATARAQQKGAGPFAILTGKELYDMTQVQASIMCSDWKEAKKRFAALSPKLQSLVPDTVIRHVDKSVQSG
jgi:hypothetical protein